MRIPRWFSRLHARRCAIASASDGLAGRYWIIHMVSNGTGLELPPARKPRESRPVVLASTTHRARLDLERQAGKYLLDRRGCRVHNRVGGAGLRGYGPKHVICTRLQLQLPRRKPHHADKVTAKPFPGPLLAVAENSAVRSRAFRPRKWVGRYTSVWASHMCSTTTTCFRRRSEVLGLGFACGSRPLPGQNFLHTVKMRTRPSWNGEAAFHLWAVQHPPPCSVQRISVAHARPQSGVVAAQSCAV